VHELARKALRLRNPAVRQRVRRTLAAHVEAPVRRLQPREVVLYRDVTLRCLVHPYNTTWRNERAIEIPIAQWFIAQREGRGLEVGHVLGHYQRGLSHTVLDLYERAAGVINEDVAEYTPSSPFDWIVSVSTLEHVGRDETPKDPAKAGHAISNLQSMLKPSGRMLITAPLGYSPGLDRVIEDGSTVVEAFYSRTGPRWLQRDRDEAIATPGPAFPLVTTVWIAELASAG
jgi:hypothetical protein